MEKKIKHKTEMVLTAYAEDGKLKTHDTPIGTTWDYSEMCQEVDINQIVRECSLPDGEYEVKLIIEKK